MKTISLGKEVYITDPCYKPSLWCCNKLTVLPGEYLADMKLNADDMPELLSVTHSDYVDKHLTYKKADFHVLVDSGQAGVVDKRYYDKCHTDKCFDEFYNKKVDTWIVADVDATEDEKDTARELHEINKQIAYAFKEGDLTNVKELITKEHNLSNKYPMLNYNDVIETGKTKKHIANLATPNDKGAFTITARGDGCYKVRLAKNKEDDVVSIQIIYD